MENKISGVKQAQQPSDTSSAEDLNNVFISGECNLCNIGMTWLDNTLCHLKNGQQRVGMSKYCR